jgi:hypothetical protein
MCSKRERNTFGPKIFFNCPKKESFEVVEFKGSFQKVVEFKGSFQKVVEFKVLFKVVKFKSRTLECTSSLKRATKSLLNATDGSNTNCHGLNCVD